jgi:Tfp pilus assembly major pilin PilA
LELHEHHRWAQAMVAIQIAISLAAITLLTRKEWLKRMAYGAAGLGAILGVLAWMHI